MFVTGGVLLAFGLVDVVWGMIRSFQSDEITERKVHEQTYTYFVDKDGRKSFADVLVPRALGAKIDLGTGEVTRAVAPPPPPAPAPDGSTSGTSPA